MTDAWEAGHALAGVTVAHLGHFDPEYSRNRIMAKALRRAGATVVSLSDRRRFLRRTPALVRRAAEGPFDAVLVGFPGYLDVATARAVAGLRRPVISDAFASILETAEDREVAQSRLRRLVWASEDRISCRLADVVLLDTQVHAEFYNQRFGVPHAKLRRVWVGADDEVMHPLPRPSDHRFRALFYGTYIPLHGVDTIVRAAAALERAGEEVDIVLVGSGQTYAAARRLSTELGVGSVRFMPRVPLDQLPVAIAESDVCLGIFGDTPKAARVIPNKVFDALAMARPVITADTPAARELLVNGRDALLSPPGDAEALAEAIARLKAEEETRAAIAERGHDLFCRELSIQAVSVSMATIVRDALGA